MLMANWNRLRILLLRRKWRFGLMWVLFLTACQSAVIESGTATAVPVPTATLLEEATMTFETMMLDEGTAVRYALSLPIGYTPDQTYPVLLALPPGPQTEAMVNAGLSGYWAAAQNRGWIVVSPIAPDGVLFFQGSEAIMPAFLDRIEGMVGVENGRFHLAGISNGGISAFRIAGTMPERFQSILVIPGLPRTDADFQNLDKLTNLPIAMFVGENDTTWLGRMQETEARLTALGADVFLEIAPNEGHVIQSITGDRLFDYLDSYRP